jgi:hypothetical protein
VELRDPAAPPLMRGVVVRGVLVVAAVMVAAWFALGVRQSHDVDVASDIIGAPGRLPPGAAAHAASLLRSAGQLNPDLSVDLLRSQLALRSGDAAGARAIALSVTRSEPEDIDAWLAYGTASAHYAAGFTLALRHLNQLAPPVPQHR